GQVIGDLLVLEVACQALLLARTGLQDPPGPHPRCIRSSVGKQVERKDFGLRRKQGHTHSTPVAFVQVRLAARSVVYPRTALRSAVAACGLSSISGGYSRNAMRRKDEADVET